MYILSQELKNMAKKLIKVELTKVVDNLADEFLDNLFNNKSLDNKYENMMITLDEKVKSTIINVLKKTIQILDKIYYESDCRKKYFNKSSFCSRSIYTIFGELSFERIYYYDKHDRNKHFCFIDELFGFPSYERYDKVVKGIAIENAISTNQKKGAEITNNSLNPLTSRTSNSKCCNISRQDIYNWIKKWEVPDIEYDAIEDNSDTLYIMVDEKYLHEQIKKIIEKENTSTSLSCVETKSQSDIKSDLLNFYNWLRNPECRRLMLPAPKDKKRNYIMSKAFITFTGVEQKNNRRKLVNKTTFLTASNNAWEEFIDFISKIYDFNSYKKIKVLSDAGTWIVSGIPDLKLYPHNEIIHCLCEFHVKQKINRITHDENQRKLLTNYVTNDRKKDFITLINSIKENKKEDRKNKIDEYKNYIIKYWKAFRNMLANDIGSSMESHICHNIAKYFSFEPKAYSRNRIQKLLKLHEAKENGINILNLYLKTCDCKEKITIKKEELSFDIFDNFSSNMPILYSNRSFTRNVLKKIVA